MNVNQMTIEEKVGQLFVVGFPDTRVSGELIHLLTTYKVGGLLYQSRNFISPKQIYHLSSNAQLYAKNEFPLFIAIEQEGGLKNTFSNGVIQGPSQSALGKINNRLYTKQMAQYIGEELKELGINMNLTPSIHKENEDNFNSLNNDLAAKHGVATIQGYQKENISSVAKYFPGKINESVESLLLETKDDPRSDLYPFYQAIQKGVDAILVSHDMLPDSDTDDPALYSSSIIHTVLRKELLFDGIIGAGFDGLERPEEVAESAILAIQSGVNLLFVPRTYKNQITAINAVIEAVKTGIILESQLDESVHRILTLKKKREIGQINSFNPDHLLTKRSVRFVEKLQELVESN